MNHDDAARITKLVLLIDGENLPAKFARPLLNKATELGVIVTARVYGHFDNVKMSGWIKAIDELRLTKVDVSKISRAKNSADFKLVIEAMDILHGRQLDGFCIASSDGDFSALGERIRANALALYGFGERKAPEAYQKICDAFFDCAELAAAMAAMTKAQAKQRASGTAPSRVAPAKAMHAAHEPSPKPARRRRTAAAKPADKEPIPEVAILSAMDATKKADGWSTQSAVGSHLRRSLPDFTSKKYGYRTMSDLIGGMKGIESRSAPGGAVFVRRK